MGSQRKQPSSGINPSPIRIGEDFVNNFLLGQAKKRQRRLFEAEENELRTQ